MIRSYLKMAWRALTKNKLFSIINIGGLSVGLATGIILLLVITDELSYDKFHTNLKDIYVLMVNTRIGNTISTGRATPGPLAASLRNEIPDIKYAVRLSDESGQLVRAGDKSIYQTAMYADPDFFNMLSFPAVEGKTVTALKDPSSVVITESLAKALFGKEDAIGKSLLLNNQNAVKVAAVIADVPKNSSIRFDMVAPFQLFERGNDWLKKWDDNRIQTWIQAKPMVDVGALNVKLKKLFLATQTEDITLFAYPFTKLRLHGGFKNGQTSGGVILLINLLSMIAGFVLLIACINFMNLTTARSERRAREVGVRKVLGASRAVIVFQFLCEALLVSFCSLGFGMLLAKLALPGFMRISGKYFVPDYSNWFLWALLLALGLVTGLVAGSYPALYLSRFQPVKVLKNWISTGKGGGFFRKALVTFQFSISLFLIIGTIVIYRQMDYVERRPIGYSNENLVDIAARGNVSGHLTTVRNDLLGIPGVKAVTAANDRMTRFSSAFNGLEWPGKTPDQDFYIKTTSVSYGWVQTMGLSLAEGRDFSPAYGADSMSCLINETAAKKMKLKEPIVGTKLGDNVVIGVVHDFVLEDPSKDPPPVIVYLGKENLGHLFVRIENNEHWRDCLSKIQGVIKRASPEFPFDFQFTDKEYQEEFQQVEAMGQMGNIFGGLAILISCLGLFGLSAYVAERRGKEISIRKVLGAGSGAVWFSLSREFLMPIAVAFLIAAPVSGVLMGKVLGLMDYHISLSWWMFGAAGLIVLVIALATVSFNGVKAAVAKPIDRLRTE